MKSQNRPYDIFINGESGSVRKMDDGAVARSVRDSGIRVRSLHILPPEDMLDALQAADDGQADLLVGGGDGTVRSSAKLLAGEGRAFGVLPLGTMNLMARDMSVPPDFAAALAAYARGARTRRVDAATVNGELFLCSACIGTIPDLSDFREENRERSLSQLLPAMTARTVRSMDRMARRRLRLTLDGRRFGVRAATLVVSSNLLDRDDKGGVEAFRRSDLRCGKLGIYAAYTPGLRDKLRLILSMGLGGWQRDPSVRQWEGTELRVDTGRGEERVSLDGETMDMKAPLLFRTQRASLPLLMPAGAGP